MAVRVGRRARRADEPADSRARRGARHATRFERERLSISMEEAEFDKFADEYRSLHAANIRWSGEDPEYFAEYKVADIAAVLARENVVAQRALDFGAGVGYSVPFFTRHLPSARVTCLDVS